VRGRLSSTGMGLEIRCLPFECPEAAALCGALQAEYTVRYGGTDETPVDAPEFAPPHGAFLVAHLDSEPVGCGGFRTVGDGVAEIKRMYVQPHARGRGVARRLLAALERSAAATGCDRIILETGSAQPEAIGLYESSGYTPVPAFGTYRCEPGSRHLGKSFESAVPDLSAVSRMPA